MPRFRGKIVPPREPSGATGACFGRSFPVVRGARFQTRDQSTRFDVASWDKMIRAHLFGTPWPVSSGADSGDRYRFALLIPFSTELRPHLLCTPAQAPHAKLCIEYSLFTFDVLGLEVRLDSLHSLCGVHWRLRYHSCGSSLHLHLRGRGGGCKSEP